MGSWKKTLKWSVAEDLLLGDMGACAAKGETQKVASEDKVEICGLDEEPLF